MGQRALHTSSDQLDRAARPVFRGTVSRALEPATIGRLRELLRDFHDRYARLEGDETARFPFLCRWAFQVLTSRNQEVDPRTGALVDCVPGQGNLDTGDASAPPYPPFVDRLREQVDGATDFARYFGPECVDGLDEAVRGYVTAMGFPLADHLDGLSTVVGSGTISLYNALCQHLVAVAGDVVLHPEVSYGFFLTQPYRAGGAVAAVPMAADGTVDVAALDRVVRERNAALHRAWLPARVVLVRRTLDELHARGVIGTAATPADVEALTEGLDGLDNLAAGDELFARAVARWPEILGAEQLHRRAAQVLRPPRVVGHLHITPAVTGALPSDAHLAELGRVLGEHRITAIEDMSYHSIRSSPRAQGTLLEHHRDTCVLFGVSKPFALANPRIGVLLVATADAEAVTRAVESTIGFVYTGFQHALAGALADDADRARAYLADESWDPATGYDFRRALLIAMVEGVGSARLSPAERDAARTALRSEVDRFFRWKFDQGVVVCPPDHDGVDAPGEAVGDYDDLPPAVLDYHRRVAHAFTTTGLRHWFAVEFEPEAGFFLVVHCDAVLARGRIGPIPVSRTFDVFGVLAHLFGVRVVPEEMMTAPRPVNRRLRLSFSPPVENLVRCLLTTYLGLTWLEAGASPGPEDPADR
ncbi:aminotransferase class I/II-fold pyridoxal phosphate-dependent enzyme [Saccharothrix syringae]|uniref:Aminotransferase n=1 Tax=Saccharothrix syringae TaxID=103733 RepID=A0A5Q0GYD6_SACSY|nr:aminotransferase class I/II-fold pyridoxal phosphate-dependent enzyme [Saccharothrix syringae]QFZ18903.1 aminotransferase class I/II-fold pyridoxal phosphate-dependent enzyme [Saccharothrix syringae]